MNPSNKPFLSFDVDSPEQGASENWLTSRCSLTGFHRSSQTMRLGSSKTNVTYDDDWSSSVPRLIQKLAASITERKKQELRFNLLEILTKDLHSRIQKLECAQTKIVPIDTFAPEPYVLLKPFRVSVQAVHNGFEAGWFDANIHTGGANEEEAVSNLKSLILDFFDSLSNEPVETLGPEPKRQLAVIKTFVQRVA